MRKCFVILLLPLQFLAAQNYSQHPFYFGLKIGGNFAHIVGAEQPNSHFGEEHSKFGFALGGIFERNISKLISLEGELLYDSRGSKWGQQLIGLGDDGDYVIYNLKYISIPLYLKFSNDFGDFLDNFDFILGFNYSYNISAKQEVVIESDGTIPGYEYGPENIRDDINKNELGVLLGIKIPYNKKRRKIYINVQFYWALTNLYKSDAVIYPDGVQNLDKLKNRNLSISFEYFFK